MASAAPATTRAIGRDAAAASSLWPLVAAGLIAFGAACGVAIAYGEIAAFYVTLALVGGIAVLFDYRVGAVLLILLLPIGETHYIPHGVLGVPGLNPVNVLLLATLLSCMLRGRFAQLAPKPLVWLYIVPIVIAGLLGLPHVLDIHPRFFESETPLFTTPAGYFREMAVRPLFIPLMAVLVAVAVARSQKPERFLMVLVGSVAVMAITVLSFILASGVHFSALSSPFLRGFFNEIGLHANQLGRLFAVGYALLLFVWWETKEPGLKAACFVTLALTTFVMVLTFSRAGFLFFFMVSALFLLWKLNARTVALAVAGGAVAMILAPHYVWRRITFGMDADANTVSADRIEGIWGPLLPELWNTPLWGNGIGAVMWSPPMLSGEMMEVSHPHNAYLEALYDMGVIGLVLLLAYYWHVWRNFRALGSNAYLSPELRGLFQGATAALVCLLVTGMSGSTLRPETESVYLWVAIGMMYGVLARKTARS